MTSVADLIDQILSQVPEGHNPYAALADTLHSQVYSSSPKSFKIQVWLLIGVLGIALLASLLALGVRFARIGCWLYKLTRTTSGTFITPNSCVMYLIFNSIFLILFMPYAYYGQLFSSGSGDLRWLVGFKTLVFFPLWIAAWHSAWGTALSGVLRQSPLLSHTGGPIVPGWALNSYFCSMMVVVTITIFPLEALAIHHWGRGWDLYLDLNDALHEFEASWSGDRVDMEALAELMPSLEKFFYEMDRMMHFFRVGWSVWAAYGCLLVATMVPAALLYVKTLQTQIKAIRRPQDHVEVCSPAGEVFTHPVGGLIETSHRQSLSRAFVNLLFTSVSLCVVVSVYTGVAIWTAVDAPGMLRNPKLVQASYLLAIWIYVAFAGTAITLLLIRSFNESAVWGYRHSSFTFGHAKRQRQSSSDSFKLAFEKKKSMQIVLDQSIFVEEEGPSSIILDSVKTSGDGSLSSSNSTGKDHGHREEEEGVLLDLPQSVRPSYRSPWHMDSPNSATFRSQGPFTVAV